jgi:hypothetical protein
VVVIGVITDVTLGVTVGKRRGVDKVLDSLLKGKHDSFWLVELPFLNCYLLG